MSRRTAAVLLVLAALATARGVLFMLPGVRFDADQAVVGLMAKHISEGRASLFFYGQSYLLAIEAYRAAPVMWLFGPTEIALKLPLLAMNLSILVYWLVACSQITIGSLRYDLLALPLPVGAVLVGVQHAAPPARAGLATAVLLWIGVAGSDYVALAGRRAPGPTPTTAARPSPPSRPAA